MKSNKAIKKDKERKAGDRFIKLHNEEGGYNFAFKEQPEEDPPDLIYEDLRASKTLLLEITAAYYNQDDAKWVWDIKRGIDTRKISPSPLIQAPDSSSYNFLNNLIQKKCRVLLQGKKKEHFCCADPIFLVIDLEELLLTTSANVQEFIDSYLVLPHDVPFQEIWLLLEEPVGRSLSPGENVLDIPLTEALQLQSRRFRLYPGHSDHL